MTREEIIAMARQHTVGGLEFDRDGLVTFFNEAYAAGASAEREAMVSLAAKQGWAMKNEDSFEDAVREIAAIRTKGQA